MITQLVITQLVHTQLVITPLVHTPLVHTQLVLTQLAHTQLNSHTTCSVTSTFVSRGRRGTWSHPHSFHVAGVALGDIQRHFAWQAWHLRHWAGSAGAPGSQLTPWAPRLFAWQAWH